jgi:hypothetical protein
LSHGDAGGSGSNLVSFVAAGLSATAVIFLLEHPPEESPRARRLRRLREGLRWTWTAWRRAHGASA